MGPCDQIETGADRLLCLVNEENEITLTAAANKLKVNVNLVDAWSEMLEEAELIEAKFSLTEKCLCSKSCPKKKLRRAIKRHTSTFFKDKLHNELEIKAKERELKQTIKEVSQKLKQLEKFEALSAEVKRERELVDQEKREFDERVLEQRKLLMDERKTLEKEQLSMRKTFDKERLSAQKLLDKQQKQLAKDRTQLMKQEAALKEGEAKVTGEKNRLKVKAQELTARKKAFDKALSNILEDHLKRMEKPAL